MPNFYDLNDDGQLNGSDKDNPKNQQGGAFVVYWSVSAKYDGENSQPGKKVTHVLWAATKDFTNETYMFGGVFVPNSKYNRGNTIDTTMLQNGSRTYRTTGSGVIFMEYTDRADWWRANDQGQYATDPAKAGCCARPTSDTRSAARRKVPTVSRSTAKTSGTCSSTTMDLSPPVPATATTYSKPTTSIPRIRGAS